MNVQIQTIAERRTWLEQRAVAARRDCERKKSLMHEYIGTRGQKPQEFFTEFTTMFGPLEAVQKAERYQDICTAALKEFEKAVTLCEAQSTAHLEAEITSLRRQLEVQKKLNAAMQRRLERRRRTPSRKPGAELVVEGNRAEEIERLARNITAWLERSTTPRVRKTEVREALGLEREALGQVWSHLVLSGQITASGTHVELRR